MDGATSISADGIWYYDNTKQPGPTEQRNYVKYPSLQQDLLNEALRKNVSALILKDPRSKYDASVDLEIMEQICWGVVRAMKFTDRDGRVLISWDCLNEETVSYKNERSHFDTLSCYLYWKQYSCQLKCEFTDPAALQDGD